MTKLKTIEKKGNAAVKRHRIQKLLSGYPFMFNSKELVTGQCYLEYPTGSIKLVKMVAGSAGFEIIRELSDKEAGDLRKRYRFFL